MTKSRRKKKLKKILNALSEKAPLSTHKGEIDRTPKRRPTTKQRRHRGWRTPRIVHPTIKYSEMIEDALEPQPQYDEWMSWKDGLRFPRKDMTRFIPKKSWVDVEGYERVERNKRLKKNMAIRKAKMERNKQKFI